MPLVQLVNELETPVARSLGQLFQRQVFGAWESRT